MLAGDEAKLRLGLFDLLQNIILIRDPKDAWKFYRRFNLEDTTSFQDLDDHWYVLHHVMTVRLCVPGGKKMKGEDVDSLRMWWEQRSHHSPPSKCILK